MWHTHGNLKCQVSCSFEGVILLENLARGCYIISNAGAYGS